MEFASKASNDDGDANWKDKCVAPKKDTRIQTAVSELYNYNF